MYYFYQKQCTLNEEAIKTFKLTEEELESLLRTNGALSLQNLNQRIESKKASHFRKNDNSISSNDDTENKKSTPTFGVPEKVLKRSLI